MAKKSVSAFFVVLFLASGTANSYELGTHARITLEAYKRSALSDPQLLDDLGISNSANPFGRSYYDLTPGLAARRAVDSFEEALNRMPPGSRPLSIEGWLMRGAIREDDVGFVFGHRAGEDPHDDPYGPFWRVMNHFYDPAVNAPLTLNSSQAVAFATATGEQASFRRAPDWAIGSPDAFNQPSNSDPNRRNHFTVFDAREAFYRALTGRDHKGTVVGANATERNIYWATTFRALGDVLHLPQDMAQPQHTRNDVHGGVIGFGEESAYEYYIDARATGAPSHKIDGVSVTPSPLDYHYSGDDYPIPEFSKYSDFFSTREGLNGRGLADYSNRGFFSAGTNLGSNQYTSPSNDVASYTPRSVTGLLPAFPGASTHFLVGDVPDYLASAFNATIRMTTESAFYDFVPTVRPVPPGPPSRNYWLNRFNYDDMAKLLIPRAVAYSAGLINYFFRGKIDLVVDPTNAGRLLIRNLGKESMKGKFRLFYDDASDVRRPVLDAAGNEIVWDTELLLANAAPAGELAPGASMAVDPFPVPANPAPKLAGDYMLVFAGDMGEEKADPASGTVGAVVGKRITAPYNGALYVAGRTATGLFVFFKVDKNGVSVLKSGEFNPLQDLSRDNTPRERAYHFKEVEFTQAPGGGQTYKTIGLALSRPFAAGGGDLSFVPNPVSGVLQPQSGIAWLGDSGDPAIGTFEFHLSVLDFSGRQAQLFYTRRFTNADGQLKQTTGVLDLPVLPSNAGYSYKDFSKDVLMVNGNGTAIYPRGGASFRRYGVRISLSATPSAALFDLPQPTSTFTSKPFFDTTTVVGECSVDFIDSIGRPSTFHAARTRRERLLSDEERTSDNNIQIEDFINGELLTWTARSHSRTVDHSVTETCEAKALDFSKGAPQIKVNVMRSQKSERIDFAESDAVLPTGSFQSITNRIGVQPASAGYVCGGLSATPLFGSDSYLDMSYSYAGFAPCPLQTADAYVFGVDDPKLPQQRMYRPLTNRIEDAVYGERSVAEKFRDHVLVPGPGFVADASPIGEVFIAAPDLSYIVHEPKPGHMPVLTRDTIPAGIVELRAVLWM